MPVFNSLTRLAIHGDSETLSSAIKSLLEQSFEDFELLILDNQSTDGTYEKCCELTRGDKRVRVLLDDSQRFAEAAIEKLARIASGEFVIAANDDDQWDRFCLEKLMDSANKFPEIDLHIPNGFLFNMRGISISKLTSKNSLEKFTNTSTVEERCLNYFYSRIVIPTIFGLFRRSDFVGSLPISAFDSLKANTDNRFIFGFFLRGGSAILVDEDIFYYRDRPRRANDLKLEARLEEKEVVDLVDKYVSHQIDFWIACVTDYRSVKGFGSESDYFEIMSLEGMFSHIANILSWILDEYSKKGKVHSEIQSTISSLKIFQQEFEYSCLNYVHCEYENRIINPVRYSSLHLEKLAVIFSEPVNLLRKALSSLGISEEGFTSIDKVRHIEEVLKSKISLERGIFLGLDKSSSDSVLYGPLTSILVNSMNLERYVEPTITSIIAQKGVPIEILVADGGSTDDSVSILERFNEVNIVSRRDSGFIEGFWNMFEVSQGKYVGQCCISDGYSYPLWVHDAISLMENNPDVSLVWGFPQYIDESGIHGEISYSNFIHVTANSGVKMFNDWLQTGFYFPEGNFIARREVWNKCFPTHKEVLSHPVEPFLEFTKRFHTIGYLSAHLPVVANFGRIHAGQLGSQYSATGQMQKFRRIYRRAIALEKLKILKHKNKKFVQANGEVIQTYEYPLRIWGEIVRLLRLLSLTIISVTKQKIPDSMKTKIKNYFFKIKRK
jgi:glycosyltransferase involved in cell wall biosynthesis